MNKNKADKLFRRALKKNRSYKKRGGMLGLAKRRGLTYFYK